MGGVFQAAYEAAGGEGGALGAPVGDQVCGLARAGCRQDFLHGAIVWSSATSARAVEGVIADAWRAAGSEAGSLGYPTAEGQSVGGGSTQTFEGGTLRVTDGVVQRS
jgi:uncharacterized protein with LGFP repeats